ncbi:MAG: sulfatase [Bacteroides sp.]|nr:sulfatase [Bacteroides sp.]MCM1096285.1 sulfatase [Terasakiella sp.]
MKKSYLTAALAGLSMCAHATRPDAPRPDIVLINLDDMGVGDIGVEGAQGYLTPNIDRMAARGTRFTQFYAASAVSSASRAGLMTGCYPSRISINGALKPLGGVGVDTCEQLMPEILADAGYATAMVGKWHIGDEAAFLPTRRGFDEWLGLPYSNDMWPYGYAFTFGQTPDRRVWDRPDLPLYDGERVIRHISTMDEQSELTTLYTERAVDFIRRTAGHRPYFLYFAHTMVHVPLPVAERFRGRSEQGLFGDAMMEVDWSVGEILRAISEAGREDSTLVIFTSDNGAWMNFGAHAGCNGGLREAKHSTFEGGQRVPCIMLWPGHVPEAHIVNRMASQIDLLPTLAALAGADLPRLPIDGVDISALVYGDNSARPHDYLYYYVLNSRLNAVRDDRFKLVVPHRYSSHTGTLPHDDGTPGRRRTLRADSALYDLRRDPGERYNVLEMYPDEARRLGVALDSMRVRLGDSNTGIQGREVRPHGYIYNPLSERYTHDRDDYTVRQKQ